MSRIKNIIALDCGNSSFRIVLGRYDGEKITTEVISQTPNDMVKIHNYFYWDFLKIYECFIDSLKKVLKMVDKIDSIGVCTWGVDFALYDKSGNMLGNPLSYRNTIGEECISVLSDYMKKDMFYKTGILSDKINSVYMLSGIKNNMPELFGIADKLLMIPDIINYMLTGVMINEPSELSTTQIMNSKTKSISREICEDFGIETSLFSNIGVHGKPIGNITEDIKNLLGIDYDVPVICVPSHDTASAVVAIPAEEKNFAFISSGTWSLIGTELDEPIINDKVMDNGLTNEVGAFNKITMLKNSAGMFIIQRIKKEYDAETGVNNSWDELDRLAEEYSGETPLINVNSIRFFNPKHMGKEIWKYLCETNQAKGDINWSAVIKAVHESMACCYANTITGIEDVVGKKFDTIYIVGGGSKNIVVNELTAKRTGKKVVACSKESTSLGNIATQVCYFEKDFGLDEIRKVIKNSVESKEYISERENSNILQRYWNLP